MKARESVTVVKIGGNVVDNPAALKAFIADFAKLKGKKILVHGGGKEATRLSAELDIPTVMIDGRRVTDAATIDVVTMVYAGLINKRIVAALQAAGCDAIGLAGCDGNAITATKRPAEPVDYGFVGDISLEGINTAFISSLLRKGVTPVFCAIMHDGKGTLLNCNADSVASAVAVGMAQTANVKISYCFEKKGVLSSVNDDDSVIPSINLEEYETLREDGVISKGMIPKIDNAFAAIRQGVQSVRICQASDLLRPKCGTTIKL